MIAKSPKRVAAGIKRSESLTPDRRKEIAKKAIEARWAPQGVPRATHEGTLRVFDIPCAVLEDGSRVLSQKGVGEALGRQPSGKLVKSGRESGFDQIPYFVAGEMLKPFISNELRSLITSPKMYTTRQGGVIAHGFDAAILPQICEVWLKARDAGVLTREAQVRIAAKAEAILRGLATIGVVALVDEATGYQEIRPRDALQKYLEKIIRKDLAVWSKRFPDEFYENIYKLKNWQWQGMSKNRYSIVAHYTRDLVYERLAPSLIEELEKKNPADESGRRPDKFHQYLTDDVGHPMLANHLQAVLTLQKLALANRHGWTRFLRTVDQILPKKGTELELPLMEPEV